MGSDEFTVHLISTASMDFFRDNTLASFRNFCKEEIALDGDWRVALSEIIFLTKLNNVTDEEITYFRASEVVASKSNAGNRNTISRPYYGEKVFIKSGEYTFIEQLIDEIKTKLKDKIHFDASPQEITNSMSIWMNANEGISFPSPQIPSLLGYNAKLDENGEYHIGYKMIPSFDASYEGNELYESHFPYDLSSGTSLSFVYIDIIQYQTVGDAKAPLLRVIDSNRRIKNGSACSIEPNHRKNFTNLDYKKLFTSSVQSISVQLRTETGRLVPFAGTGKVVLTSSFPHFSGHYRQRGSGFGALAAGIGRVAIPFARRVILPAAKKLGRKLLMSAAPELIDVAMKKKSPKQALKNTVTKTARKQLGSGRRRRKTPMNGLRRKRSVGARKRKTTIRRKTRPVRSRADFFSNIKNDR